jgi:polysaccharide biosynthesis/export protein
MTIKLMHNSGKLLAMVALLGILLWGQPEQNKVAKDAPQRQASLPDTSGSSSLPSKAPITDKNYVIGNEDVLAINVWKEPDISRSIPVRSDGKITLPLLGELLATGKTPKQLEADIATSLRPYMSDPEVTVMVQEIRSQKFNVLGHIARPGSYTLTPPMTVLDAIAMAGGFRDFAKVKSVYVLRRQSGGDEVRLPFNYKEVIRVKHTEQNVKLEPGDTIVVP